LVTRSQDGRRVTSANDAAEGTSIQVELVDGRLTATVRQREMNGTSRKQV
jgi:exonuclease VII large subunit